MLRFCDDDDADAIVGYVQLSKKIFVAVDTGGNSEMSNEGTK